MALLPKSWQGPVLRDLLANSIRRAPTSHSNNNDSLLRVVLHRNVLAAATADGDSPSPTHSTFRRLPSDLPLVAAQEDLSAHARSHADAFDKIAWDSSRSTSSAASSRSTYPPVAYEQQAEDAWFEQVMNDLDWTEDLDGTTMTISAPSSPLLMGGPPPVHGDRTCTLPTIPE